MPFCKGMRPTTHNVFSDESCPMLDGRVPENLLWAKALGASTVITAATGAEAIGWMHALGADVVVDYEQQEIFDALADDTVDAVFDNYGGNGTADKAMPKLRVGGTYLLLPHGNGEGALSKHPKAGVTQINFGDVDQTEHATLDQLATLFDSGALRIKAGGVDGVQRVYSFDQAASAYQAVAAGQVHGKIAIAPATSRA